MNIKILKILTAIFIVFFLTNCNEKAETKPVVETVIPDSSAISIITEKIKESPDNAELFFNRAEIFSKKNNEKDAIKDIKSAISLDSLNSKYYIKLAEYNLILGKSGKSKEALEKCLSFDPENIETILKLAEIHLFVKQYNESMKFLNKAQSIDPLNAKIYFIKSIIYKENGNIDKAIESMQISIVKDPDQYSAYIVLGRLYFELKDSLALEYFRNASKLNPENIETYYNIAKFYQENNEPLKAINEYNYLITNIDSTYYFAHFNIGHIHMEQLKNYPLAIEYFSKVLEMDTVYIQAIHNRGLAYELSNQYDLARKDYNHVLRLVYNYKLSIDGLNRLDSYK